MHTLRLHVDNKIYKNLIRFPGRFSKNEIQIEEETEQLISNRQYLEKELNTIEEGKLNISVLRNWTMISRQFYDLMKIEILLSFLEKLAYQLA